VERQNRNPVAVREALFHNSVCSAGPISSSPEPVEIDSPIHVVSSVIALQATGMQISMHKLTLRVLAGADRGRVFPELGTPMTIGREEGNTIRLNDERVSRYHVKIQEDDGRLVVTDLESTNGTRVNGHLCNLKILRLGDTIAIGRSVLLIGTSEQIAGELFIDDPMASRRGDSLYVEKGDLESLDNEAYSTGFFEARSADSSRHEFAIPRGLSPGQAAELRDLLDYIHNGMRVALDSGVVQEDSRKVIVDSKSWQSLLALQGDVSELIRTIEDPPDHPPQNVGTGTI
jgi:hypothetical protein